MGCLLFLQHFLMCLLSISPRVAVSYHEDNRLYWKSSGVISVPGSPEKHDSTFPIESNVIGVVYLCINAIAMKEHKKRLKTNQLFIATKNAF